MNKIIALTLAASLFTSHLYAGEIDKELHEKCLYPTVMIFSQSVSSVGTGVILKSSKQKDNTYLNLVATCAHILKMTPAEFETENNSQKQHKMIKPPRYEYVVAVGEYEDWSKLVGVESYECEVRVLDEKKDIALITFVSEKKLYVVDLDLQPKLYISNEVYRIGCGMADPFRLDYGRITSIDGGFGELHSTKNTYRTSIPTVPGDSGGPVFHKYKLIGVTQAVRSISTGPISQAPIYHISYVIPLSRYMGSEEVRKYLMSVDDFKDLIQD
jgi:hypothetical protein